MGKKIASAIILQKTKVRLLKSLIANEYPLAIYDLAISEGGNWIKPQVMLPFLRLFFVMKVDHDLTNFPRRLGFLCVPSNESANNEGLADFIQKTEALLKEAAARHTQIHYYIKTSKKRYTTELSRIMWIDPFTHKISIEIRTGAYIVSDLSELVDSCRKVET